LLYEAMPSTSCSAETRLLGRLLRIAPYATTARSTRNPGILLTLRRRGLIDMDAWGVVSLTQRGELAAMAGL